jgi:hypothetical protein
VIFLQYISLSNVNFFFHLLFLGHALRIVEIRVVWRRGSSKFSGERVLTEYSKIQWVLFMYNKSLNTLALDISYSFCGIWQYTRISSIKMSCAVCSTLPEAHSLLFYDIRLQRYGKLKVLKSIGFREIL